MIEFDPLNTVKIKCPRCKGEKWEFYEGDNFYPLHTMLTNPNLLVHHPETIKIEGMTPIVRSVDYFYRNKKLFIRECKVCNGEWIIIVGDTEKAFIELNDAIDDLKKTFLKEFRKAIVDKFSVPFHFFGIRFSSNKEGEVGKMLVKDIETGRKVLALFSASWCRSCPIVEGIIKETMEAHNGNVIYRKIDVQEETKLCGQFGINGLPTVVFFNNGGMVRKITGNSKNMRDKLLEFVKGE